MNCSFPVGPKSNMRHTRSNLMIFVAIPLVASTPVLSNTNDALGAESTVIRNAMAQTGGSGLLRTPHAHTLGFG
jgi:predicted dinucleotide-binding enzyme